MGRKYKSQSLGESSQYALQVKQLESGQQSVREAQELFAGNKNKHIFIYRDTPLLTREKHMQTFISITDQVRMPSALF